MNPSSWIKLLNQVVQINYLLDCKSRFRKIILEAIFTDAHQGRNNHSKFAKACIIHSDIRFNLNNLKEIWIRQSTRGPSIEMFTQGEEGRSESGQMQTAGGGPRQSGVSQ